MSVAIPTGAAARRIWRKAKALVDAWIAVFGATPTKHAVIRAMSVAEFESRMGDAGNTWAGEHNWGAVQKRALTKDERATLAAHGISPAGGEDAVLAARRLLPAGASEALHRDYSPKIPGWYFAWFWSFPTEAQAAAKFVAVLVKNRSNVAAIIDTTSPAELAAAMYASHYYEGTDADPAKNVAAYARRISETGASIEAALVGWDPSTAPAVPDGPAPPAAPPEPEPPPPAIARGRPGAAFFALGAFGFAMALAWTGR